MTRPMTSHLYDIEKENIQFLMSEDGGMLTLEAVANRLGVELGSLQKRMSWQRRKAGKGG